MQKKIFQIIALPLIFLVGSHVSTVAEAREDEEEIQQEGEKKFLVTAYYSPLPDQSFYIRGSYEADKELNGQGIAGADGTEVYMGMLAAPPSYAFGTQIKLPGLGVGEVHDRGGAIQAGEDHDRIDVWMGHGEEGLSRALNWGSRFLEGEIFEDSSSEAEFDYTWLDSELSEGMLAQLKKYSESGAKTKEQKEEVGVDDEEEIGSEADKEEQKPIKKASILPPLRSEKQEKSPSLNADPEISYLERQKSSLQIGLGKGAEGHHVKALQQTLKSVGYFQADLTGIYDQSTIDSIVQLQKDAGVIESREEEGAGFFGPKTEQALYEVMDQKREVLEAYPQEAETEILPKEELPPLDQLSLFQKPQPRSGLSFELNSVE